MECMCESAGAGRKAERGALGTTPEDRQSLCEFSGAGSRLGLAARVVSRAVGIFM